MSELPFLFLVGLFLLVFLSTSVEFPLNLNPISINSISLVASFFFPPSLFWPLHFVIVVSSPCHELFLHVFKHLFSWFHAFLMLLPTYSIGIRILTRYEDSSGPPPSVDIEMGRIRDQD
ncbi:hypothetical protein V6N13_105301 [Hibiscus sabdariffa]|uniref:Transmembrane protein n=1 Tax=Hibiscus sabdariffa TaxID=183260 RepID=A0ABR2EXX6_9ROSI